MTRRSALERDNRRLSKNANEVRRAGRGGDSMLVHVNPAEKRAMDRMFGPASRNPHTGLPEHGLFSKLKKAVKFELWHGKKILKGIKPTQLIFGIDPIGTKIGNAVTGRHDKPVVNQLGGARSDRYQQYEDETGQDPGYAPQLQQAANTIAGAYGGQAVGGLAGKFAGEGAAAIGGGAAAQGAAKVAGSYAGKYAMNSALDKANNSYVSDPKTTKTKATKFLLGRAQGLADRPYTPYEGERVAGLSANEQRASALAQEGNPDAMRNYGKAESAIDSSLKPFNAENLDPYLSPYRDSGIRVENEEYDRQKSALLNSKAGAWGGDRAAFEGSELNRTHMNALTDINAKAYEQATNAFFQDSERSLRASDAYRAVGGDVSQLNRQQIQDLMATGGLERTLNQANLDFDYQQFTENRDWSVTNLEPLLRALGTTGQKGPGASGQNTAAAIGAAATIAGAYFSAGNTGSAASTSASAPSTPIYGNDD